MSENFGRLQRSLIGGSLRIYDKLVLDENLNLCVGNITSGNVCGSLIADTITEKNSMEGINVYGNINMQPGYYVNGGVVFELNDMDIEDLMVGNVACITETQTGTLREKTPGAGVDVFGDLRMANDVLVNGDLLVDKGVTVSGDVCAANVVTDVLRAKTTGNLTCVSNIVLHPTVEICAPLATESVRAKGSGTVTVTGNITLAPLGSVPNLNLAGGQLQAVSRIDMIGDLGLTVPSALPAGPPVPAPAATMLIPVTINGMGPFFLPLYS